MEFLLREDFWQRFATLFVSQMRGIPVAALCLVTVLGSAAVFAAAGVYARASGKTIPFRTRLLLCMVLFYACFMLMITFFNREPGGRQGVFTEILPFLNADGTWDKNQLVYSALNVILFVPWGMLLLVLWDKDPFFKKMIMVLIVCFICSFSIEALQMATSRGYFELGDIVMNTLGGVFGALFISIPLHFIDKYDKTLSK